MGRQFVFSLTGTDRVGIVDDITQSLLELGANIETSRMSRLGGEFAVLMLISLADGQDQALDRTIADLAKRGYKITTTPTEQAYAEAHPGWIPYHIEVHGADHEGIIHTIAHGLRLHGISIESMDTATNRAPNSGTPLFSMKASVVVPPELNEKTWQAHLDEVSQEQHVDIRITSEPRR